MPAVQNIPSSVSIVTPPTAPDDLPITIDALKLNCGFGESDTALDSVFRSLILESTDYVEEASRCYLRPVVVDEFFEFIPSNSLAFRLSRYPVRSITSIKYYDLDGVLQTMSTDDYNGWLSYNPPLVCRKGQTVWPSTQYGTIPAVTIRYAAGPVNVDEGNNKFGLIAAVKLIATATYQNGDGRERSGPLVIPEAAKSLIMATAMRGL